MWCQRHGGAFGVESYTRFLNNSISFFEKLFSSLIRCSPVQLEKLYAEREEKEASAATELRKSGFQRFERIMFNAFEKLIYLLLFFYCFLFFAWN